MPRFKKAPVWQPVLWQVGAPPKPALGAPCNGCGLCCLAEPCPLGMVLSRRRSGPCVALRWSEAQQRYLCAAVAVPATTPWGWLARRWIAAGVGCDAELEKEKLGSDSN